MNQKFVKRVAVAGWLVAAALLGGCRDLDGNDLGAADRARFPGPTRSSGIAITSDGGTVIVPNRDRDSVSILRVRDGQGRDAFSLIAEVPVGDDPRFVAIAPDDSLAYVANAVGGDVSVIALSGPRQPRELHRIVPRAGGSRGLAGGEIRGIALSPNGTRLVIADYSRGTVTIVDTASDGDAQLIVDVGRLPTAIAITNDGDGDDLDERILVSRFYAETIPGGPGPSFDDGKQGVIDQLSMAGVRLPGITLPPLVNAGFTADRSAFCKRFNPAAHSDAYCPDVNAASATDAVIAQDPQGAYPNQLQALLLRGGKLYAPSIGASPEPPVRFNVNVQALVHVADLASGVALSSATRNLNAQIRQEIQPDPAEGSLQRLFANDIVAIDATLDGGKFLVVSRGGNNVLLASLDAEGGLILGAPQVTRFQTGHLPSAVVIGPDGRRAYVANEVGRSVTAIDLDAGNVIRRDIAVAALPEPGSFEHQVLLGKLAFFTALGLPQSGLSGIELRDIDPVLHRNQASDNGWSGCGSCHGDGLSDEVSWIFATGPRNTLSLDAFFAKNNPGDQRISNWSGVMGSITDFNNNARNVQGGRGFVADPSRVFQHGITVGASEALDAMTLWVQTVNVPVTAKPTAAAARAMVRDGRELFEASCASCHGGAKWSKSEVLYANNPTFTANPAPAAGIPTGTVRDPGLVAAGTQIVEYSSDGLNLRYLESVGTFDPLRATEIRANGTTALGSIGFNVPSLLGAGHHFPYLHDGSAERLSDVWPRHGFGRFSISQSFVPGDLLALEAFIESIDGSTEPMRSDADVFRDAIGR